LSYKSNSLPIDKLKKLVVRVHMLDERKEVLKYGTGFFLDSRHIITANHVVSDAFESECSVRVLYNQSGQIISSSAQVLHRYPKCDFNILKVDEEVLGNDIEFVRMVPNSFRKREFSYSAYGFPNTKPEGHYQSGVILDENIALDDQHFIDVSLGEGKLNDYRGYSGSPVVCNGQLIGIAIEQSVGLNAAQSIKVLNVNTFAEILFKEWLDVDSFIFEILEVFRHESENEIAQNKKNGKYIPEIFVELGDMKEYLRGFSDPALFFEKHLDYIKRHHFEQYNQLLDSYGIQRIGKIKCESEVTLDNIVRISDNMINQLNDMLNYVTKLSNSSEIRESVPEKYLDLFDMSYYAHRLSSLSWEVEDRIMLFESLRSSQVLLTEKAGQGKTNLLCDFTENVLLRKNIPCLFISTRNLTNNNINDTIMGYFSYNFSIDDLFQVINYISKRKQLPFIVVLDGINEQKDVINAKRALYDFLNKVKVYKFIRVLMTSRTEYFEEKFGDILEICPQLKIFNSYNWKSQHWKLNVRVFEGYMEHFNIQVDDIGDSIYDQLSTDFLLLRMFSEAYQGTKELKTFIPALLHLFRYEIFERYYNYKKENLKNWDRLHGVLDSGSTYDNLVDTVTNYMVQNMQFSNIERSVIVGEIQNDLLVKLIEEDIIFREDIMKKKGLMESSVEVINFTFDEFRDFCIAKKLIESFSEDNLDDYKTLITKLTSPDSEAAEGIQKYLFFASKKFQNEIFTGLIVEQKWFYNIYFNNIFSVSEEYLEERDITFLIRILTNINFYENHYFTVLRMYSNLIKRYNTSVYTKLNIRLLVIILEEICDKDFTHYIHDVFKPSYEERYYFDRKERIHIDKLVEKIKVYYVKSFNKDVFFFLGYLSHRGLHVHDFFDWCVGEYPEETIEILEALVSSDNDLEVEVLKHIVRDLSYYDFDFKQETIERWEKIKEKCKENEKAHMNSSEYFDLQLEEILKNIGEKLWKEEE